MARIFRDDEAADRMKAWLASQGFENAFLDKDKTTGIPPGAYWERTLYREIEQSQAVIILQTLDWLASKWCFAKFTQARALGKGSSRSSRRPLTARGLRQTSRPSI